MPTTTFSGHFETLYPIAPGESQPFYRGPNELFKRCVAQVMCSPSVFTGDVHHLETVALEVTKVENVCRPQDGPWINFLVHNPGPSRVLGYNVSFSIITDQPVTANEQSVTRLTAYHGSQGDIIGLALSHTDDATRLEIVDPREPGLRSTVITVPSEVTFDFTDELRVYEELFKLRRDYRADKDALVRKS
jgi:hypothetical protein